MIGSIFYFSGMGSLLGSALAEGVYVPESGQRTALDADAIESALAKRRAINRTEQVTVMTTQCLKVYAFHHATLC